MFAPLRPLIVVALLAPLVGAQGAQKQAIAQAKAGLKAALKVEKAALAEVEDQLDEAIDTLAQAAQAGPLTAPLLEGLLPTWLDGMNDLSSAVTTARISAATVASAAVATLATEFADLDGQFPTAFYFGGDGFADDIVRRTAALAEKTLARLRQRADEATHTASKAGVGLTIVLAAPNFTLNGPSIFHEDGILISGLGAGGLLLAIGTSDLDEDADGLLLVGGQISGVAGPMDVALATPFDGVQVDVEASFDEDLGVSNVFGGVLDDDGNGLLEGNGILSLGKSGISIDELAVSVP